MLNSLVLPLATSFLFASSALPMADVFVDQNAASCATGTGSVTDPVCSITTAISLASPGDTIRIAPGTYNENITVPFDLDLIGTGGAAVTTVDGFLGGSVFTIPASVTVEIDGLEITRGGAPVGGGIRVSGDLVLTNSTVVGNYSWDGAGIAADMLGGGANVTIRDSVIRDNRSVVDGDGAGATVVGGGISQRGGSLTISNTTISNNIADVQQYYPCTGLCFYADRGRGGGIYAAYVDLLISNSTISECKADAWYGYGAGGGVFANQCTVNITNTTLSGNRSHEGRSIRMSTPVSSSSSSFSSVTITGDRRTGLLGPPSPHSSLWIFGPLEMRNCLVVGNSTQMVGSVISLGHNLFDTEMLGVTGGVLGDIAGSLMNPLYVPLSPLAENGGPTQTHALVLGSLAIDAGDPVTFEAADQRGVVRPAFGLPDIGAFEADALVRARDLCNGTGSGMTLCANCPCNNNAPAGTVGGCLNSAGTSARIIATGDTSVSLSPMSVTDLRITMTGATASSFSVMYSGDAIAPGGMANPCFGLQTGVQSLAFDGLRCAIVNTRRHGGRATDSNGDVGITNNAWGGANAPPAGLATQAGFVAGQTRFFQGEYREDSMLGCMRGLNTSQAVEIVFAP